MYQLNTTLARQADQHSTHITEPGKYIGVFKCAEDVTSSKGTRGIQFTFITALQQTARFTLWTRNTEGQEIFGYKQLQALMVCLDAERLDPTPDTVTKWDSVACAMLDSPTFTFKALMGKQIGILFETEEYEKQDKSIGLKALPYAFFDAKTELMAAEILDKKVQPQQLSKIIPQLKHRPLRLLKKASQPHTLLTESLGANNFNDIDDEIPF